MEWDEKFEASSQIKAEPIDYDLEYLVNNAQFYDKIEIEQEFKTEPLDIKPFSVIDENDSEVLDKIQKKLRTESLDIKLFPGTKAKDSGTSNSLVYCPSCDENWHYFGKRKVACLACSTELKFKCRRCHKTYDIYSSLNSHHIAGSCETKISCELCDLKTYNKVQLQKHMKTHDLKKCRNCATTYPRTDPTWIANKKSKSTCRSCRSKLKCSVCTREYGSVESLELHRRRCELRFVCDDCGYKTHEKFKLGQHIKCKHLPPDEDSRCGSCGKNFPWVSYLKTHVKTCRGARNSKGKSFACNRESCQFRSRFKKRLKTHVEKKHPKPKQTLYKCMKCQRIYVLLSSIKEHLKLCAKT